MSPPAGPREIAMTTVSGSTSTAPGVTSTPSNAGTSSTGGTTTASTAAAASINFNDFLQMMIAEMKNQDPTNPSDPTQYLTQMAQFSNVQQGILTNTTLNSMLTTSSLDQAENLIGKSVTSADGTTSGTVQSVALSSSGTPTATLTSGTTLTLDNTVTVGKAATAAAS